MWPTARTSCGAGTSRLPTTVKGRYFYWYMIKDVYSRKLVANEVHESESAEQAAQLLRQPAYVNSEQASRWYCTRTMAAR